MNVPSNLAEPPAALVRDSWNTVLNIFGIVYVIVCLSFAIASGIEGWPGLHQDAALYVTPIITYATDGQWRFTSYTPLLISKETDAFNGHGQLYQIIFGAILRTKSYESLLFRCGVTNALTYVVYMWLFWLHFHRRKGPFAFVRAIICATVPLSICVNLQGRPEHLIPIFTAIPALLRLWSMTAQYARPSLYATAGFVFLLSPIPGVMYSLAIFCWIWLHDQESPWRESLRAAILTGGIVTAVLVGWFQSDVFVWFQNTIGARSGSSNHWWLATSPFSVDLPFWNVAVLCLIAAVVAALVRRSRLLVLLIVVMVGFVLLPPALSYSYAGLLPIGFLTFTEYGSAAGCSAFPGILSSVITVSYLANVFTFFRYVVLLAFCMTGGVNFQQAKLAVSPFISALDVSAEKIGFPCLGGPPSFVVLGDPTNPWITVEEAVLTADGDQRVVDFERKFRCRITCIVLPQRGHYPLQPPEFIQQDQFELVMHNWSRVRPKIFGVKLGGAMPGYQFAVYRRRSLHGLRTDETLEPQPLPGDSQ